MRVERDYRGNARQLVPAKGALRRGMRARTVEQEYLLAVGTIP